MWVWRQDGRLYEDTGPLVFVSDGYSGADSGKNNPSAQTTRRVGPIPVGAYRIAPPIDHPELGPVSLRLEPLGDTKSWGRSGFLIHGDSRTRPGDASHGCIVLPRPVRERIAQSDDGLLVVISGVFP